MQNCKTTLGLILLLVHFLALAAFQWSPYGLSAPTRTLSGASIVPRTGTEPFNKKYAPSRVSCALHKSRPSVVLEEEEDRHEEEVGANSGSHPRSIKAVQEGRFSKWAALVGGALVTNAYVKVARAADVKDRLAVLPECADSIIVFRKGDRKIVMIGTAHISEESVKQVRRTIETIKPDLVMIELDRKRVGRVSDDELESAGFVLPPVYSNPNPTTSSQTPTSSGGSESESSSSSAAAVNLATLTPAQGQGLKPNFVQQAVGAFASSIRMSISSLGGQVLGKALGQFYNSVEKLGFQAGGEFKAAVETARVLEIPVLLGDRDVDVTLSRLAAALAGADTEKFTKVLEDLALAEEKMGLKVPSEGADGQLVKADLDVFVESMKQKEVVNSLLAVVEAELPDVYNALIGERDQFMADSMLTCGKQVSVGVVGLAHLRGIEKYLVRAGFSPVKRNCPVPKFSS